jgi:hypothetical protein
MVGGFAMAEVQDPTSANPLFKGTVQQKLRWVKSGINR